LRFWLARALIARDEPVMPERQPRPGGAGPVPSVPMKGDP
jgi:hypothetical protein